jgi:hypothetical protein
MQGGPGTSSGGRHQQQQQRRPEMPPRCSDADGGVEQAPPDALEQLEQATARLWQGLQARAQAAGVAAWLQKFQQQVEDLRAAGGVLPAEQLPALNQAFSQATAAVALLCLCGVRQHPELEAELQHWLATALQPLATGAGARVPGAGLLLSYAPKYAMAMDIHWQLQLMAQLAQLLPAALMPTGADGAGELTRLCQLVARMFRNPALTAEPSHDTPGTPFWLPSAALGRPICFAAAGAGAPPPREQPGWGGDLPADAVIGDVQVLNDTLKPTAGHPRGAPSLAAATEGMRAAMGQLVPALASSNLSVLLSCGGSTLALGISQGQQPYADAFSGGRGPDSVEVGN